MRVLVGWLALFVAGVTLAGPPEIQKRPDEKYVSLIQLVANPEAYDGKHVNVGGYLVLRDEYENSLSLDENSHRSGMWANSVAIDFQDSSAEIKERARHQDRKYVVVAGRFVAGSTAFSLGKLQDIYYLASAPPGE